MSEADIPSTFSPQIPHPHAWPYVRAYSAGSVVYYRFSDEASLPVYDQRFWSLVGRHIKVIGHVLVESGCQFVPQSEGQFLSRPALKDAWNALKGEEKAIRKGGLSLVNFETGETILFTQPDYRTAWPSFEAFEEDAAAKLQVGCIYFLVPEKLEAMASVLKDKPYKTQYTQIELLYDITTAFDAEGQEQKFGVYCVTVDCPSVEINAEEWKGVTNYLHSALKG